MINSPFLIFPKNNTFSCKLGFEEFLNNLTSSRHRFYYLFPTEIPYFLLPISLVFNEYFEIAILFNIVQRSNIYGFDNDKALHSPWGWALCGIGRIDIARIGIACIVTGISVSVSIVVFFQLFSRFIF
jgi:hypothetical protein